MKISALIVLVLLVSLVRFSFAQEPTIVTSDKPRWHKIGEIKASFEMRSESIAIRISPPVYEFFNFFFNLHDQELCEHLC